MVFAHIFGIPVEETALTFAPVILVVIAGARISSHQLSCKLHRSADRPIQDKQT
jgi:hypothetical protein